MEKIRSCVISPYFNVLCRNNVGVERYEPLLRAIKLEYNQAPGGVKRARLYETSPWPLTKNHTTF